jgi:hypothetical protein
MLMPQVPRSALWLGLAGLIPFAAGALAVWGLPPAPAGFARFIQMAYGACILSFLGAVHWGLAMAGTGTGTPGDSAAGLTWKRAGGATVPALLGWIALVMTPLPGMILLIASFAGLFWADVQAVRLGQAPTWYLPLRRLLTIGVVVCLGISALRVVL